MAVRSATAQRPLWLFVALLVYVFIPLDHTTIMTEGRKCLSDLGRFSYKCEDLIPDNGEAKLRKDFRTTAGRK